MNARILNAVGLIRKEAATPGVSKITNKALRRAYGWLARLIGGSRPGKGLSTPKIKGDVNHNLFAYQMSPNAPKNKTAITHVRDTTDYGIGPDGRVIQVPEVVSDPPVRDRDIVLSAAVKARDAARISRELEHGAKTFPPLTDRIYRKPLTGSSGEIFNGTYLPYADLVGRQYKIGAHLPFKTFSRSRWPINNGVVWDDITGSNQIHQPLSDEMIRTAERVISADIHTRNASELLQRAKFNRLGIIPKLKVGPYKTK